MPAFLKVSHQVWPLRVLLFSWREEPDAEQTFQLQPPLPRRPTAVSCLASSFSPLPLLSQPAREVRTGLPEAGRRETASSLFPFRGASLSSFSPWLSPGSDTWFRELAACSKPWGYPRAFSGPAGLLLAPSSSPEQGQVLCQMLRDYVGDPPPGITGVPCGPHWPFKQKAVVETRHIASTQCM